jgi:hypothetical protein
MPTIRKVGIPAEVNDMVDPEQIKPLFEDAKRLGKRDGRLLNWMMLIYNGFLQRPVVESFGSPPPLLQGVFGYCFLVPADSIPVGLPDGQQIGSITAFLLRPAECRGPWLEMMTGSHVSIRRAGDGSVAAVIVPAADATSIWFGFQREG